MFKRNRLAMVVAEFLGTGVLTLTVLSVQRSQLGLAYFVAIAAGIAVAVLTYVLGSASGAQMNPALTFGLWTARRVRTLPAIVNIVMQCLGAWAAYGLYHYFVNTNVQAITQAFSGRILVAEAVGTMVFGLAWAAAAYNRYETGKFASVAGLGFAVAVVVASAASVGLANPALALGTRAWAVFTSWNGWANYLAGPVLGGVIGVNLYGLLFAEPDNAFGLLRVNRGGTAASEVIVTETIVEADEEAPAKSSRKSGRTAAASTSSARSSKKTSAKKSSRKR